MKKRYLFESVGISLLLTTVLFAVFDTLPHNVSAYDIRIDEDLEYDPTHATLCSVTGMDYGTIFLLWGIHHGSSMADGGSCRFVGPMYMRCSAYSYPHSKWVYDTGFVANSAHYNDEIIQIYGWDMTTFLATEVYQWYIYTATQEYDYHYVQAYVFS